MKRRRPARKQSPARPWEEVRKDKVARARRLIADAAYPPPKVEAAVARLLARRLHPSD